MFSATRIIDFAYLGIPFQTLCLWAVTSDYTETCDWRPAADACPSFVALIHSQVPTSPIGPNRAARFSVPGTDRGVFQAGKQEHRRPSARSFHILHRAVAHCAADPTNPSRLATSWSLGMTRAIQAKDRVAGWIQSPWVYSFLDHAVSPCVADVSAEPYLPVTTSSLFSAARYALALATMMSVSAPCPPKVRLRSVSFCASKER